MESIDTLKRDIDIVTEQSDHRENRGILDNRFPASSFTRSDLCFTLPLAFGRIHAQVAMTAKIIVVDHGPTTTKRGSVLQAQDWE